MQIVAFVIKRNWFTGIIKFKWERKKDLGRSSTMTDLDLWQERVLKALMWTETDKTLTCVYES